MSLPTRANTRPSVAPRPVPRFHRTEPKSLGPPAAGRFLQPTPDGEPALRSHVLDGCKRVRNLATMGMGRGPAMRVGVQQGNACASQQAVRLLVVGGV